MIIHAKTQTRAPSPQPAYNHGHDDYPGYGWMGFVGVIVLGGNAMVQLMMMPPYRF